MKVLLILVALIVAVYSLDPKDRVSGENGWYLPYANYTTKWIDLADGKQLLAEYNNSKPSGFDTNPVFFYLYTKSNPLIGQQITPSTIQSSNFNSRNPTRFVIHGWTKNYNDDMNKFITSAWLSKGDYNVICVDWLDARSINYISSLLAIPDVGKKVGEMIKSLQQNNGMSLNSLYVIGHSLGAHVAGFAGKTVGAGKVDTIIGLDPALPLFPFDKPAQRLSSTDAKYVEVIHTNGGQLGFLKPIGKGDFYINGGKLQPGCGLDMIGSCSHGRSWLYYVEAVKKGGFNTIKCSTYEKAVAENCGTQFSNTYLGANHNADKVDGFFYVPIKD